VLFRSCRSNSRSPACAPARPGRRRAVTPASPRPSRPRYLRHRPRARIAIATHRAVSRRGSRSRRGRLRWYRKRHSGRRPRTPPSVEAVVVPDARRWWALVSRPEPTSRGGRIRVKKLRHTETVLLASALANVSRQQKGFVAMMDRQMQARVAAIALLVSGAAFPALASERSSDPTTLTSAANSARLAADIDLRPARAANGPARAVTIPQRRTKVALRRVPLRPAEVVQIAYRPMVETSCSRLWCGRSFPLILGIAY